MLEEDQIFNGKGQREFKKNVNSKLSINEEKKILHYSIVFRRRGRKRKDRSS